MSNPYNFPFEISLAPSHNNIEMLVGVGGNRLAINLLRETNASKTPSKIRVDKQIKTHSLYPGSGHSGHGPIFLIDLFQVLFEKEFKTCFQAHNQIYRRGEKGLSLFVFLFFLQQVEIKIFWIDLLSFLPGLFTQ